MKTSLTHQRREKKEAPRDEKKNPTEKRRRKKLLNWTRKYYFQLKFSVSHYYSFLASDLTLRDEMVDPSMFFHCLSICAP
jgi:hypothetical protein